MNEIQKVEREIGELVKKLERLRKESQPTEVKNYTFQTLEGEVSLADLFAGKNLLFAIHNMGQGCRYCTLWADGLNPFLPHLEDQFAVILFSKDPPDLQRRFANSRGWRFRTASHGGGDYIREQTVSPGNDNMPGLVVYENRSGRIFRKNSTPFGPGDLYCSLWHTLSLAGVGLEEWTPQYSYWRRPSTLDDGGANIK